MSSPTLDFPLARFTSLVGVHTALFLFIALYLPRSSYLILPVPPQASSRDRPQHPFLQPLTADPLLTLAWLCIGSAVVQASWAGWLKSERDEARVYVFGEDDEEKMKRKLNSGRERLHNLKDSIVSTLAASVAYHAVAVLLGAPFVSYFSKTYSLALLLSILTVYPAVYTLHKPSWSSEAHRFTWLRLFAELSPRTPFERFLVYPAVGSVAGAWLGAMPIALDWDRPWQASAWPLTPAYGSIFGYLLGMWTSLITNTILFFAESDKAETTTTTTGSPTSKAKLRSEKRTKRRS